MTLMALVSEFDTRLTTSPQGYPGTFSNVLDKTRTFSASEPALLGLNKQILNFRLQFSYSIHIKLWTLNLVQVLGFKSGGVVINKKKNFKKHPATSKPEKQHKKCGLILLTNHHHNLKVYLLGDLSGPKANSS